LTSNKTRKEWHLYLSIKVCQRSCEEVPNGKLEEDKNANVSLIRA